MPAKGEYKNKYDLAELKELRIALGISAVVMSETGGWQTRAGVQAHEWLGDGASVDTANKYLAVIDKVMEDRNAAYSKYIDTFKENDNG